MRSACKVFQSFSDDGNPESRFKSRENRNEHLRSTYLADTIESKQGILWYSDYNAMVDVSLNMQLMRPTLCRLYVSCIPPQVTWIILYLHNSSITEGKGRKEAIAAAQREMSLKFGCCLLGAWRNVKRGEKKRAGWITVSHRSLFYWSSPTSLIRRVWNQYNELCYLRTRRRAETSSFDSICQYLDEGSGDRWYTRLAKSKRKRLWMLEGFLWCWMEKKKSITLSKGTIDHCIFSCSAISFLQTWQNV